MKIPYFPKSALSFKEYFSKVENLVEVGRTSGPNQTDTLIDFTRLNLQRMKRLVNQLEKNHFKPEVSQTSQNQIWYVITEAWCGDAAQNVPVISYLSDMLDSVELRIIFRDEHPEIMDAFLTNGGRSIPKLIAVNQAGQVLFYWGPRPKIPQEMMLNYIQNPDGKPKEDVQLDIQKWYNKNQGKALLIELGDILNSDAISKAK